MKDEKLSEKRTSYCYKELFILQETDVPKNKELNELAEKLTNHVEAILVVQDYEKIIRSKTIVILNVAFTKVKSWNDSKTLKDLEK